MQRSTQRSMQRRLRWRRCPLGSARWLIACVCAVGFAHAQALAATDARTGAEAVWQRLLEAESRLRFDGRVEETVRFPPGAQATTQGSEFEQPPGLSPALIDRNFVLRLAGVERVAGRGSHVLALESRSEVRPSWRFWVDDETGLRLGYEQRAWDGQVVASGRYVDVERVEAHTNPSRWTTTPGRVARPEALRLLGPEYAWEGFVPVRIERSQIRGQPSLRLTLWDGLSAVVLLAYPSRGELAPAGAYLQSRDLGRVTLSLLGPLPGSALEGALDRLADAPIGRLRPAQIERWRGRSAATEPPFPADRSDDAPLTPRSDDPTP